MNDAQASAPDEAGVAAPRRGPRRALVGGVAFLAIVAASIGGAWLERRPLAGHFIDRALAAKNVPARYRITRFAIGRQRLEDISIGDPKAPDLTAEWAEVSITAGLGGASVRSIRAGGVRIRGRLIDGRVSLGAIDRLLPAQSGEPFALPDLYVSVEDARMRLETPAGTIGIALMGEGNLSDGFQGKLAAVTRGLAFGDCRLGRTTAFVNIAVADHAPAIDGPVRLADFRCPAAGVTIAKPDLALDMMFDRTLARWRGAAVIQTGGIASGAVSAAGLNGRISIDRAGDRLTGGASLLARSVEASALRAEQATFDGRYAFDPRGMAGSVVGEVGVKAARADAEGLVKPLAALQGTPVGPIGLSLADTLRRAAADFSGRATIAATHGRAGGAFRIEAVDAESRSGARLVSRGAAGRGFTYYWPQRISRIEADVGLAGGGFPQLRLTLTQRGALSGMRGQAVIAPVTSGNARLALTPIRFGPAGNGGTAFATRATIDGPIGDGRITGLTLPIAGRVNGRGALRINEACAPLDFSGLSLAGMAIGATRLPLCPVGGALVSRAAGGSLAGGGRIAGPRLTGRSGNAPLAIEAGVFGFSIGTPGFVADAVRVRLGQADAVTRLDVARLTGAPVKAGLAGRFEQASGRIGNVPLLLSEGRGDWALSGGALALKGSLRIADAAAEARFEPLVSRDVELRLVDGVVRATGQLREPKSGTGVTDVALFHDLRTGEGQAVLDVPGIAFGKAVQPEALTRLTLGVVANVVGTLKGRGEVRWDAKGVTSDGLFSSDGLDLAAAFGPVKGLKGDIRFSDLLGLETPPGQIAHLGEINPGVAVNDGVLSYQLLAGQRIRIENGRWPFSGGQLTLEETVLDFGRPSDRHLTFRVSGMDAASFVQQFDFRNLAVTGTFDGVLPMIFDDKGGRIVDGRLAVRKGGGTLAYVGEVSNADLGTFGKLAFDALKSIRYDSLAIELNGSLDGEIISRVVFDGVNEAPKDGKQSLGMFQDLTGLPFKFNVTIRAPFRGLLNSAQSLTDPRGLISQSLPRSEALPGSTTPAAPAIQPK